MGAGWSIAWRVHDAQFWGVPQRRRRIALVADFGGSSAPEILFERKSLSGDSDESGSERKRAAGDTERVVGETIKTGINGNIAGTLDANYYKGCRERQGTEREIVYCLQGNGIDRADTAGCNGKGWREDQSYTLNTIDRPAVCVSQDAYDKYSESDKSATIKQSGGIYGGGRKLW